MSQSLDRGLTILELLASGSRSLDDVAKSLDVHKSTAMRLLRTLEEHHLVHRDAAYRYRLGSRLFDLAQTALAERDVRQVAAPHLRALNERLGHTLHVATYESDEAVYIDKYESRHQIRMYSQIGRRAPLHCTAVGKVLVAWLSEPERRAIAERISYPRFTANTITGPEEFLAVLDEVRQSGYAVDRAEHEDFINCIAAPVRDASGHVLAAVSMSVPRMILELDGVLALLPSLRQAADAVSAEYGWTEPSTHPSTHEGAL